MVMMDVLSELTYKLATRHKDLSSGKMVDPLLGQLRGAIHANLGKTHSGHSPLSERSPLDLEAFDMYEDIDGRIASLWQMATETGHSLGSPEKNLLAWYRAFCASWALRETNDAQMLRALARLSGWANRIENYFDPAQECEILAACPSDGCGRRYWIDALGIRHSALVVEYRPGRELVGRCRSCATTWHGDAQLIGLAKAIEAPIDVDAIREARAVQ